MKKNIIFISLIALFLTGCATANVATHEEAVETLKAPQDKLPDNFKGQVTSVMEDDGWLKSFNDPMLVNLVDEALKNNPGLKIAEAKVDQARGLILQSESKLKPTIGLGAEYADGAKYNEKDVGTAGATMSWELDVWGKLETGVKKTEELQKATLEDYKFAKQSLAASVTKAWFTAVTSKLQLDFANEIIAIQKENLRVVTARKEIGQGNGKDVHLAKAELSTAKEASQGAQIAYEDALRSLELLLGRYPSADIQTTDKLVAVPPKFPAGVPSQVLERRPDMKAMESRVAQAFYQVKEAELLHLPSFKLTLGLGINSATDAIEKFAAGIFAPIYTGGKIEGQIATATAKQKQAIAQYVQVALVALKEVEGTLNMESHLIKRKEYLNIIVDENFQAYNLTKKQYEIGEGSLLDVLVVQQKWISAEIAKLDMDSKTLINRVNMYMALGGSFETK